MNVKPTVAILAIATLIIIALGLVFTYHPYAMAVADTRKGSVVGRYQSGPLFILQVKNLVGGFYVLDEVVVNPEEYSRVVPGQELMY